MMEKKKRTYNTPTVTRYPFPANVIEAYQAPSGTVNSAGCAQIDGECTGEGAGMAAPPPWLMP